MKQRMRTIDRLLELSALALFLCSLVYLYWWYGALPERIAIHFDAQGKADGWDDKSSLFIFPVIMGFVIGLLATLGRFLPPEAWSFPGQYSQHQARYYTLARTLLHGMQLSIGFISVFAVWSMVSFNLAETPEESNRDLWVSLAAIALPIVLYFVQFFKVRRDENSSDRP